MNVKINNIKQIGFEFNTGLINATLLKAYVLLLRMFTAFFRANFKNKSFPANLFQLDSQMQ
jgi:hypothetical protein